MPRGRRSSSRSSNRNKRSRSSSESSRSLRPRSQAQPSQADNNNDNINRINNEEKKDQSSMDIDEKKISQTDKNKRQSKRGRLAITNDNADNDNIISLDDYEDGSSPSDQSLSGTMSGMSKEALNWMLAEYQRAKNKINLPPSSVTPGAHSLSLVPLQFLLWYHLPHPHRLISLPSDYFLPHHSPLMLHLVPPHQDQQRFKPIILSRLLKSYQPKRYRYGLNQQEIIQV